MGVSSFKAIRDFSGCLNKFKGFHGQCFRKFQAITEVSGECRRVLDGIRGFWVYLSVVGGFRFGVGGSE